MNICFSWFKCTFILCSLEKYPLFLPCTVPDVGVSCHGTLEPLHFYYIKFPVGFNDVSF